MPCLVYLAGPEVFLPNGRQVMEAKAELARKAGFVPLSPGDLDPPKADTKRGFACNISAINEQLMQQADAAIVNLTPFRGIAADTGTSFETGYMGALGKPVFAYTNVEADHYQRVKQYYNGEVVADDSGRQRGPDGLSIENFDMVENLMLDGGILRRGGQLMVGNVSEDVLYTDLDAYKRCLEVAARKLLPS